MVGWSNVHNSISFRMSILQEYCPYIMVRYNTSTNSCHIRSFTMDGSGMVWMYVHIMYGTPRARAEYLTYLYICTILWHWYIWIMITYVQYRGEPACHLLASVRKRKTLSFIHILYMYDSVIWKTPGFGCDVTWCDVTWERGGILWSEPRQSSRLL